MIVYEEEGFERTEGRDHQGREEGVVVVDMDMDMDWTVGQIRQRRSEMVKI